MQIESTLSILKALQSGITELQTQMDGMKEDLETLLGLQETMDDLAARWEEFQKQIEDLENRLDMSQEEIDAAIEAIKNSPEYKELEAQMAIIEARLAAMGVEVVFNHADYRLISARVLKEFANFKEVNLYLRGMVPLVGFKSTSVYYERHERLAGESHYPLKKMLALAFDGITSLSVKPIRMVFFAGLMIMCLSFIGIIWAVIAAFLGQSVAGWASLACIVCFMGGVQCLFLGVIGEYIGKIYLEVKGRPRYIISERTWEE